MGQLVHIEIEMLVTRPNIFQKESDIGKWCWVLSYTPSEREAFGFNALLDMSLKPVPKDISETILRKIQSWKHQETLWWCGMSDFLKKLGVPESMPASVQEWYFSWASIHLPLLGNPEQIRVIIWVTEGNYD